MAVAKANPPLSQRLREASKWTPKAIEQKQRAVISSILGPSARTYVAAVENAAQTEATPIPKIQDAYTDPNNPGASFRLIIAQRAEGLQTPQPQTAPAAKQGQANQSPGQIQSSSTRS